MNRNTRRNNGRVLELRDEHRNVTVNAEVIAEGENGIRTIRFSDDTLLAEL